MKISSTLIKGFFVLILIFLSNPTSAQGVQPYLATKIAFQEGDNQWGDFKDTSVLIVTDFEEDVITIYSKKRQVFQILEDGKSWTDSDGDPWASFRSRNEKGIQCNIKLAERHSTGGQNQLYIIYPEFKIVYSMRSMR